MWLHVKPFQHTHFPAFMFTAEHVICSADRLVRIKISCTDSKGMKKVCYLFILIRVEIEGQMMRKKMVPTRTVCNAATKVIVIWRKYKLIAILNLFFKWTDDVNAALHQRRCNIMTLH